MSLTLQSDTEAQAAAPTRRSILHGVAPLPAHSAPAPELTSETTGEPAAAVVAPGWYADPMGSTQSRWWDGSAWTAELSIESPVEPLADAAPAAPSAAPALAADPAIETPVAESAVVETAVVESAAVETAAVETAGAGSPVSEPPAAPLSRRQLRELVGPLTTGPVLIDAPTETPAPTEFAPSEFAPSEFAPSEFAPSADLGIATAGAVATPLSAVMPGSTEARSPFEALFESSPAERASAESTAFDPTAFLGTSTLPDSSVARAWVGAAAPLVPAASAPVPVAIEPSPTGPPAAVPTPVAAMPAPAFSSSALGFTLPPDPFATPSAAAEVTPTPFVSLSSAAAAPAPTLAIQARSTTVAVWLFALLPVVHAAAVWLVLGLLDLGGAPVVRYSVLGGPLFLYLMLAFVDGRVLRARGFRRTASAILALLPPLYLLVRAIRVGAVAVVPLLLWLLLQTAAFSFILLQLPAVFALVPLTAPAEPTTVVAASGPITDAQRAAQLTPTGMAAELTRQTLAKNLTFSSISCPPIPVTLDGTAVSCTGTLASVKMNLNVVIDSTLPNSAFALVSEAPAA